MITNGRDNFFATGQNSALPNVSTTLESWLQTIEVGIVTKTVTDNRVTETVTVYSSKGVLQPFKTEQLELKPEGERSWQWYTIRCQPSVSLRTDDRITIRGNRYTIMGKLGYDEYGLLEYEAVKDYDTTIEPV